MLWYYNLGKYFVFANVLGLTIVLYQVYLFIKPVSKRSLYSNLKFTIKKFLINLKNDFEKVNSKIISLLGKALAEKKERKKLRLIHNIPSYQKITKNRVFRKSKKMTLFYFILGLLFFNISLYYGLSLDKEVFIYGYIGFIFSILILIFVLYFVYRIIRRLIRGKR